MVITTVYNSQFVDKKSKSTARVPQVSIVNGAQ